MKEFIERISKLSPKRLALLTAQLQAKVEALESAGTEPIAILGMGCRFPGGGDNPESFWRLLRDGVDGIIEAPPYKWDVDAYYDPDPGAPGKMSTRWGGFLTEVDKFDPQFFGISPREAVSMDPQHRLLLEVTWEALEHAGQAPDKLFGSQTGVFVGISSSDYYQVLLGAGQQAIDAYFASGAAHSIASGRLSYFLGVQGPSLSIDTACSSSLVAIHQAVQSLRAGECDLALAGGVNVILSPETSITLSKASLMAPDGRCKAFDARADGFTRGEGCGMVVIKRLADAEAHGDHILAVIQGSAINQDGRSNGITAPNGPSQEAVIRQALADAGVKPSDISYVETHGTGTSLGDPIEAQALGAVLGQSRPAADPVMLGSVKTNIGHLESAAGVAGLIKVVLALQHKEIPPHLHFQEPNPYIPWQDLPVTVPTERTPWETKDKRRLAGLSSFGFSGTNVHLIIGEAPVVEMEPVEPDRPLHLFTLSAKHEVALQELATLMRNHLTNREETVADLCFTANTGRSHFSYRLACVAASTDQVREKLAAVAVGENRADVWRSEAHGSRQPKIAFLFTGQGAQYVQMGRQLYETQPVFRATLDKCDELLRPYLERPLLSILYPTGGEASPIDDTAYTQPAIFAIEVALAELWQSWGIRPTAVMGHSIGEYAAACVAGVLSLEEGARLIAERGRLMQSLPRNGTMAVIFAAEVQVRELIAPFAGQVDIAAINGPESVVISGLETAVTSILGELETRGIRTHQLNVSHAFHSSLMDPILDEFARAARSVTYHPPNIDYISTLLGRLTAGNDEIDADYWHDHVRHAVRFSDGMEALRTQGYEVFVEIGPSPILLGMGQRCLPDLTGSWLPSLRKGHDDWKVILGSLASLYTLGVQVNWASFDRPYSRQSLALPTYPFQRERFWAKDNQRPLATPVVPGDIVHPWLGWQVRAAGIPQTIYELQISAEQFPFLEDHRIYDALVLPSPVYMKMGLAAATEHFGPGAHLLEDMTIHEPALIPDEGTQTIQLILQPEGEGRASFQIFSLSEDGPLTGRKHVTGEIRMASPAIPATPVQIQDELDAAKARCEEVVDINAFYENLSRLGIQFGPHFRGVEQAWRVDGEALGLMQLPDSLNGTYDAYHGVHPAHLDACLHLLGVTLPGIGKELTEAYLLLGLDRLQFYRQPDERFWCHVQLRPDEDVQMITKQETFTGDIRLFDDSGLLLAELEGIHLKRSRPETLFRMSLDPVSDLMYEISWPAKPHPTLEQAVTTSDRMFAPAQVAQRVNPLMASITAEFHLALYDDLMPELDALCSAYVIQALHKLGWNFQSGQRISASLLIEQYGVIDRYKRLLDRMLGMLAEDGYLKRDGPDWKLCRLPAVTDPERQWKALLEKYPLFDGEILLTGRCAGQLAEALLGQVDPLQLLFPGGSLSEIEKVYKDSPSARGYNSLLQTAVSALLEQYPPGRKLRILEIGAGTGGTTSHLLPHLPAAHTEYVFTDISPLFVAKAAEKFADYPFVQYQTLDITGDLVAQGFEAHQFDLIVAANVLHATADLRQTLDQVKQLLVSDGLLLLLEGTTATRFGDLTVGLTEGWWLFTDTELRPSYALMERRQWLDLLAGMGFEEATAMPDDDSAYQAVILARGPRILPDVETAVSPYAIEQGNWFIFTDAGDVGHKLAISLQSRGQHCIQVKPGDVYQELDDQTYAVNPAVPEDFQRLFVEARQTNQLPCHGIIHLWSLDTHPLAEITSKQLGKDLIRVCGSALHLTQALAKTDLDGTPDLWLVTQGAQSAEDVGTSGKSTPVAPVQATMWGLGQVITMEHPELRCVNVDLDPTSIGEDNVQMLFAEVWQRDINENQIAFRQQERRVRRLVRCDPRTPDEQLPVSFHEDATYLITGGLGGLGLLVAQWMVAHGARNLALMGRRGASETAREIIDKLEQEDARITVARGDVSKREGLAKILDDIDQTMPPLRGIIHAAGVLDDGVLLQQTWGRFARVMAAKVDGAWNLHKLTSHLSLDFFTLFSSGASLIGFAGQGNHAAANAFMDTLAHYRQAKGLPGVSINWGAWADVGAAAERNLEEQEIEALSPQEGLQLLARTLQIDARTGLPVYAQIGALPVNWSQVFAGFAPGDEPPLFAEIAQEIRRQAEALPGKIRPALKEPNLFKKLEAALPNKRLPLLRDYIREQSAHVLGLDPSHDIEPQRPLSELGLDSLMAVELRNKLSNAMGHTLPATLLFEYPTIQTLSDYLAQEMGTLEPGGDADSQKSLPEGEGEITQFDDLSEDEMTALLLEKLKQIDE